MEEEIIVSGNGVLEGEVRVSGAKNSALKLIAAAILGRGKTVLHNVPRISDIEIMSEVLAHLGADVERGVDHSLSVDTSTVDKYEAPYKLVSKMRASISVLGPLIGRFGEARVAMPGGCQIGARKIDMHLVGLEALGVHFDNAHGVLHATTPNGLHGAHVMLEFPSVGATENTLMAAVVASGTTFIENAAREPEIVDLANMLSSMGAHIEGAGSSTIEVHGVSLDDLGPCEHTVVGDRIEAGTFLVGGALTGGPVTVRGIDPSFLRMALMKLEAMGCEIITGKDFHHRLAHRTPSRGRYPNASASWVPDRPAGTVHALGVARRGAFGHHGERFREPFHVRRRALAHGRRHHHRGVIMRSFAGSSFCRVRL